MAQLLIRCLCGNASQEVTRRLSPEPSAGLCLCHCDTCRHTTGLLFTSFLPIDEPAKLDGLVEYASSADTTRWFCGTCGCHVFRSRRDQGAEGGRPLDWQVATGTVVSAPRSPSSGSPPPLQHMHVSSTKDGGLSVALDASSPPRPATAAAPARSSRLPASCHCGTVRFYLTPPDAASRDAHSNFSDLLIPFHTADPRISNPSDEKWWFRPDDGPPSSSDANVRYLAGTCVCRSCRLASGFEVQTWAFVPASNILFEMSPSPPGTTGGNNPGNGTTTLDFSALAAAGVLRSYPSSEGVLREFCPRCGATVFWHDKWRPRLIDISVGLLSAPEGARASSWLEWCRERVSFSEEYARERQGEAEKWAGHLLSQLERGLRGDTTAMGI